MISSLLVFQYGQARIWFAMSRDRLLPALFSRVHPKYETPHVSTWIAGVVVGIPAGILDIGTLGDLTNIGTLFAFVVVSAGVIILRRTQPDYPRGFRVPWVPFLPLLSMACCLVLMLSLLLRDLDPFRGVAANRASDLFPVQPEAHGCGITAMREFGFHRRRSRRDGKWCDRVSLGSAAGQRVPFGVEQFDIPHDFGSSHGSTRIIRMAYPEGAGYVPLLRRAYELWRDLEALSGEHLLITTGCVDAGTPDSATVRGSLATCREFGLDHEALDARALHRRFPGYRFPDGIAAVLQPDGGFPLPEACVVTHCKAAQAVGAEIHTRESVIAWDTSSGGVEVRTELESYWAQCLVITAGSLDLTALSTTNKVGCTRTASDVMDAADAARALST